MITMDFGNYIQDLNFGIITYCQRIDMSKFVRILTTGHFEENVEIVIENDKLGTTADLHGIYKDAITNESRQAAQDHRDYRKSREKLTGIPRSFTRILRSMTSKELDKKLELLFTLQLALLPSTPSAAATNALDLANPKVDTSSPLQLWRNIVFLITTK